MGSALSMTNKHRLTEQQYLQGEQKSEIKHEFVETEVFGNCIIMN